MFKTTTTTTKRAATTLFYAVLFALSLTTHGADADVPFVHRNDDRKHVVHVAR